MGPEMVQTAPLDEIRQILRRNALIPPTESALVAISEEHLASSLREIDPYARFFRAIEYRSHRLGRDSWIGIGADLVARDGAVFLVAYTGGAAEMAGLPDRSKLLAINGQTVAGLSVEDVANQLKGSEGTVVTLFIEYPDGRRTSMEVKRRAFTPLDVELVQSGTRRILRIREFVGGVTRPALLATLDFLISKQDAQAGNAAQMLVIDLRDAGGGDLYEAFDLAGVFLPPGTILGTLSGPDSLRSEFKAPAGSKIDMPLALLVGPDTASAAEIFAGSLQQHGRAKLVGQRTYGKCSSQTDTHLSDGSVLRYTNREVLLPDGRSCSDVGLQPDREVPDKVFAEIALLMATVDELFWGQ
jgi:carboxyl-terminal processing protease